MSDVSTHSSVNTSLRSFFARLLTKRRHWRETLQHAKLSHPIKCCIESTVQATRLWKNEKADVAEDLISHFCDGIEAGTTEETLLNSFGDTRQTAKMIRKAKIRCRRLSWHVALWFWRSVAILMSIMFGAYLLAFLLLLRQVSSSNKDYWAVLNSAVPDVETAWPKYESAIRKIDPEHDEADRIPANWLPESMSASFRRLELSESDHQFLRSHFDVMVLLHEASQIQILGVTIGPNHNYGLAFEDAIDGRLPHESSKSLSQTLPQLCELMAISRLVRANCENEIRLGNSANAYRDVETLLGLADQLPQTIYGAVNGGLFSTGYAHHCIRYALEEHPELWTNKQLVTLSQRVAESEINVEQLFADKKIVFMDMMQHIYSDNGSGDGIVTIEGLGELAVELHFSGMNKASDHPLIRHAALPIASFTMPSRAEVEGLYEQVFDHEEVIARTPFWEQIPEIEIDKHSLAYAIIHRYLPNSGMPLRMNLAIHRSRKDAIVVGIAMELFYRSQGKWPEDLEELTDGYLEDIPRDVINNSPLKLAFHDTRPVLYGLGADGDDDGGAMPRIKNALAEFYYPMMANREDARDGDWVLWGTSKLLGTSK